jgi:hypothetical protein
VWNGFNWLRIRGRWRAVVNAVIILRVLGPRSSLVS